MDRRSFLKLGGAAALAAGAVPLLGGCTRGPAPKASTTTVTGVPTTTTLGKPDWPALAAQLSGRLVLPGSPGYRTAAELFNPIFDAVRPAAVAYCVSAADVQRCIAFARHYRIQLAARSGGHSYAGYSTTPGLVIDVTRMAGVTVDQAAGTATVGAGARLIDVYAAVAQSDRLLSGGSCPTVGIAGLTLGGGLGVVDRSFGLACDNLLSLDAVTAASDVVTCDSSTNADLLWASAGGGGGNFGVTTSFTFKVHPVPPLGLFTLVWDYTVAADVVEAWLRWAPHAPDEIWANCLVLTEPGTGPTVRVTGVSTAGEGPLTGQLKALRHAVGKAPAQQLVYTQPYLEAMKVEAGCTNMSTAECHLPSQNPAGRLMREAFSAKSDFLDLPPSPSVINALVGAVAGGRSVPGLQTSGVAFDACGGAINRVPVPATAFSHRDALCSVQYTASWSATASSQVITDCVAWLDQVYGTLHPHASGYAYQNYIDPDLADWEHAYYGPNLERLQTVKAAYDPDNVFHFAQSIPLP